MRISKHVLAALALATSLLVVAAIVGCAGGTTGGTTNGTGTDTGTTGDGTGTDTGTTGDGTGDGASGSTGNTIVAKNLAFSPRTLEVSVGDTVTFSNEDATVHDVEIDGENLGRMSRGDSLTWTVDTAGTFSYLCTIHPSMTGEIVVK